MYPFIPAISQTAIMHWSFQSSNPNKQPLSPSFKKRKNRQERDAEKQRQTYRDIQRQRHTERARNRDEEIRENM